MGSPMVSPPAPGGLELVLGAALPSPSPLCLRTPNFPGSSLFVSSRDGAGGRVNQTEGFIAPTTQVQNISQSMEVLDLRTYRDLQYVRNTESLMKGLDSRLKVAAESQKSLNAKSFQVSPRLPDASRAPWDRLPGLAALPEPAVLRDATTRVGTLGRVLLSAVWVAKHLRGGPRAERPRSGAGGRASLQWSQSRASLWRSGWPSIPVVVQGLSIPVSPESAGWVRCRSRRGCPAAVGAQTEAQGKPTRGRVLPPPPGAAAGAVTGQWRWPIPSPSGCESRHL